MVKIEHKVKIYGASDDLIEVEGIFSEEFNHLEDHPFYIGFSEGTLVRVGYDGIWHIDLIYRNDSTFYDKHDATDENGDDYSDMLTIIFPEAVNWMVGGTNLVRSRSLVEND